MSHFEAPQSELDTLEEAEKASYKQMSGQRWKRLCDTTLGTVRLNSMKRGDELRSGVLQMVKVYIATKRVISVSAIRWRVDMEIKGVISKVLPG